MEKQNGYYALKTLMVLTLASQVVTACEPRPEYPEQLKDFDREQLSRLIDEVTR